LSKNEEKERKKYLYRKTLLLESIFYDFVVLESEKICIDREAGFGSDNSQSMAYVGKFL